MKSRSRFPREKESTSQELLFRDPSAISKSSGIDDNFEQNTLKVRLMWGIHSPTLLSSLDLFVAIFNTFKPLNFENCC